MMSCEVDFNISDYSSDEETEGQGGQLTCQRLTATAEPEPDSESSQALISRRSFVYCCPQRGSLAPPDSPSLLCRPAGSHPNQIQGDRVGTFTLS